MSESPMRFPAYGDGGDLLGSRRARHAFRLSVAACIVLTWMLWLSEDYLRYEHTEMLFRSGITREYPEQSRAYLRQAVKLDGQRKELATPKFMFALATREEADLKQETYERAYKLDPGNPSLGIRFGCYLLEEARLADSTEKQQELAVRARELFGEATRNTPDNALPLYLEAAAVRWLNPDKPDQALTIIARTNSSERQVAPPRVLWFAALPDDGWLYAKLRREIIDECFSPLLAFSDYVTARVDRDLAEQQYQNWDSWLQVLQTMGERIARSAVPEQLGHDHEAAGSVRQAIMGMRIAVDALEKRERIAELAQGRSTSELISRRVSIEKALDQLLAFEKTFPVRVESDRAQYRFPLVLILLALGATALCFLASIVAVRVAGHGRVSWTLQHSKLGKAVLGAGASMLLLILMIVALLQHYTGSEGGWTVHVARVWWLLLGAWLGFGLIYPNFRLESVHQAAQAVDDPDRAAVISSAKRRRRDSYLVLIRRYYGVAMGFTLSVICIWVVIYRVFFALYPWQTSLLTTGLGAEEARLVIQVLGFL